MAMDGGFHDSVGTSAKFNHPRGVLGAGTSPLTDGGVRLGPGVGPLLGPSPNLQSDCVVCGENCCKMRAGGTICRV